MVEIRSMGKLKMMKCSEPSPSFNGNKNQWVWMCLSQVSPH